MYNSSTKTTNNEILNIFQLKNPFVFRFFFFFSSQADTTFWLLNHVLVTLRCICYAHCTRSVHGIGRGEKVRINQWSQVTLENLFIMTISNNSFWTRLHSLKHLIFNRRRKTIRTTIQIKKFKQQMFQWWTLEHRVVFSTHCTVAIDEMMKKKQKKKNKRNVSKLTNKHPSRY